METAAAGRLVVITDEVSDAVSEADGGWRIELGVDRRHRVDAIILALGNPPPAPPPCVDAELTASGRYVGDPWNWTPVAKDDDRPAPPLLIGTGLTMVDVALACARTEPDRPLIACPAAGSRPCLMKARCRVRCWRRLQPCRRRGCRSGCVRPRTRSDGAPPSTACGPRLRRTGPSGDPGALSEPPLVRMKDRGDIRADALGLGIDADGRLMGRDGAPRPGLFGLDL